MLKKANFLILDEPTNHLDLDSKVILENALIDYPGTILFVSHDRYFINRLATKVIELSSEGTVEYLGDYDYYVEKKQQLLELKKLKENESNSNGEKLSGKLTYQQEKEQKRLERQRKRRLQEIEDLLEEKEEKIQELEETLCLPEVFEDHEKAFSIQNEIDQLTKETEDLLEEWTNLMESLETP